MNNLPVEYIAFGTPITDDEGYITNAIVFCHGWGGDYGSLRRIIDIMGPGEPIDTKKFFIIAITTLGSLNSASPSVMELGAKFPKYSIGDMVRFQMEFLKVKFNIKHLKGVIGNSMGGFEALTWGAKYPDYMDFLISLVSSYKVAGHNYALFKFMNNIIESDPNYNNGNYTKPLTNSLKLANESMYPYGLSREYYRYELSNDEIDLAMDEMAEEAVEEKWDANDIVYRNNASTAYDIEDIVSNIKAKSLIVAINQDQYFPPELDAIPMSKMIKDSKLIIYDSIMGHIGTHEIIKIKKELEEFLKDFK
ncbi:alpha/beta fold hydrolase [Methanobrevibacter sp. TMH8]|uniref:alpha/beta fold hydrolase n=1 Tax=Methanobrevibacter sp. TMH8 TaxID=2848611 RepID=UPI001CCC7945|nr:alpha/beta fold hydrolase [Methanobrevibacter sp. TMH8]